MKQVFFMWRRRLLSWARALWETLAEPGPLETDGFHREETVFQRGQARRSR